MVVAATISLKGRGGVMHNDCPVRPDHGSGHSQAFFAHGTDRAAQGLLGEREAGGHRGHPASIQSAREPSRLNHSPCVLYAVNLW